MNRRVPLAQIWLEIHLRAKWRRCPRLCGAEGPSSPSDSAAKATQWIWLN